MGWLESTLKVHTPSSLDTERITCSLLTASFYLVNHLELAAALTIGRRDAGERFVPLGIISASNLSWIPAAS